MEHRPCFLVIDRDFAGNLSTRKLVIETAKFNVLTAYSNEEAVETLRRFPAVDGAVIDLGVHDIPCEETVRGLKALRPEMPVVAISGPGIADCEGADFQMQSFSPEPLLTLLKTLVPQQAMGIEEHEKALLREQL